MKNTVPSQSRLQLLMVTLAIILTPFALTSCEDLWGTRNNPLDTEADNYQGYPTATTVDKISLASGWDGTWDLISVPSFTCADIVGATAYHLQVSAVPDFWSDLYLAYENAALTDNTVSAADLPASLAKETTYWWRMRAFKGAWGPWSSALSFTYRPIAAVETPILTPGEVKRAYGTQISFSSATPDATFYYTTDGAFPTPFSTPGTGYTLTEAVTLRVLAGKEGLGNSALNGAYYSIAASGLSLYMTGYSGYVGDRIQLEAALIPATATDIGVTWVSDTPGVAVVTQLGLVEAIGIGEATITATSVDGGFSATCDISILDGVGVTSLDLQPSEGTVIIGQTLQLTATILPVEASNPAVTWVSDNPDAVIVSSNGLITALAAGTATITATTSNGGLTQGCTITVPPMPVSGASLDQSTASLAVGNSLQLTATVTPANATNKALVWSSTDEGVATISQSGLLTGLSAGSTTIAVTTVDGGYQAFCEVSLYVPVTGITLTPASSTIPVGGTVQLTTTISPPNATNQSVSWISSEPAIATVSETGLVTGHTTGSVSITATSYHEDFQVWSTIDVVIPVTGISLNISSYSLYLGETLQLIASISPEGATNTNITWTSTHPENVIVDSDGNIFCNRTGTSQISATTLDGNYVSTATITVIGVKSVSTSGKHTMILMTDGTLWATGLNDYGQLGDSSTVDKHELVLIMTGVIYVTTGSRHTMAIKTNGTLWAMGLNSSGQLGDNSKIDKHIPTEVMENVTAVATGGSHSLILKTDGTLLGTGLNTMGQLGDGTNVERISPVLIANDVTTISACGGLTSFIKTDGSLWATGMNWQGAIGDGTTVNKSSPVEVASTALTIATGLYHTMLIKTDSSLWATGANGQGQLGDGNQSNRLVFGQIMSDVENVSSGDIHTLILKNGSVWGTGYNGYGQLGDGTTTSKLSPIPIMNLVSGIAAGGNSTMIIKEDGSLWATGANDYGQLGDGTTTDRLTPVRIF